MVQAFKKDGVIKEFRVGEGKVFTTIELNGFRITNPTLEQFKSLGWEEFTYPIPEPYVPTLEELVEQKIRVRYSINQEFQIQRKRDTEPEAFEEYYQFVEECIAEARSELNIE